MYTCILYAGMPLSKTFEKEKMHLSKKDLFKIKRPFPKNRLDLSVVRAYTLFTTCEREQRKEKRDLKQRLKKETWEKNIEKRPGKDTQVSFLSLCFGSLFSFLFFSFPGRK